MNRLSAKLCGASLVALAFSLSAATPVRAQTCTAAPSCEALGFTKSATDCTGHSILKCPFDQTKFYCDSGVSDGDGGSEQGYCGSPEVGDVLYADMTCASLADLDKNKRVIGVIFSASRRLAIALEEKQLKWSEEFFDVPGVDNTKSNAAKADFSGKSNTKIIWAYCQANGYSCPAFEYVSNYKTVGTNAGDWYLPAFGELNELYTNKDSVNATLNQIIGTELCTTCIYWSSSEDSNINVWAQYFNSGNTYGYYYEYNNYTHTARPVLAF